MPNLTYPFTPMPLKYRFNELEPYLNEQVVFTHYEKHYKSYIDKLNNALSTYPQFHRWTLYDLLLNIYQLPWEIQNQVWVSAGGVYNHELYFATMTPNYRQSKTNCSKSRQYLFRIPAGFRRTVQKIDFGICRIRLCVACGKSFRGATLNDNL